MFEALGRARTSVKHGADAILTRRGLLGTGLEFSWWATHLATYPLGVAAEGFRDRHDVYRLEHLSPLQRSLLMHDVEAAGTPILLVHGVVDNRSVFTMLRRTLARRGFGRVTTFNYSPLSNDIREVAHRLAVRVEHVCEATGYDRIHVVGHSMGGLIARYYIQRLQGHERVHTLVTMGTPHGGTRAAHLLPLPVIRQMRPGSSLLDALAEPAPQVSTRMLALWSDLDQMVVPKQAARIEHPDLDARNVLIKGVGHLAFPVDPTVVHEIVTALAHLETDGRTSARGATSIAAVRPRTAAPHEPRRHPPPVRGGSVGR